MNKKSTLGKVANNYLTHTRKNKGITLVALVITIIILVILAGVAITALTQIGLFENAKQAKNATENAQIEENAILGSYENKINEIAGGVSASRDTVTISKEEYNKLKNANTYSEDEIEIGTWIDGRKIYRKVLKGTVVNGAVAFSEEGVTSGKNIIDYYGQIETVWKSWVNVNYRSSACLYWGTNSLLWSVNDGYSGGEYQLIVEYTKSTDNPQ